jgi:two-component system, NarL family, response regulator NreC
LEQSVPPAEPARTTAIRVLLADDHRLVRAGLRVLLATQPDIEVAGEAGDADETVSEASRLHPDVVVMDLEMPKGGGLEATRRISESGLASRVLILTAHAEAQYLLPVLRLGGSGYLLKDAAAEDLAEAIRAVHRGEAFLPPSAATLLVRDYLHRVGESEPSAAYEQLSPREREVLRFTAEGYDARDIGERLYLSPKTVETYRRRAMEKLGLQSRVELVRYALRHGLLQPETP